MSRMSRKRHAPRLLSLCTGIGGIDLAAEMAGWEIAGQCEIDPFCQRVLARHWPDVKRVADIRAVWGDSFNGPIDLVAGGFPCQPTSVAGQRRGSADARWLWPEVLRVIQIYQPAWYLLENVVGLISLGLDGVLADLDAAGYEAWPLVFPAAAVGAPHLRDRVFIVGHVADANRDRRPQSQGRVGEFGRWVINGSEEGNALADADSDRCGNGAHQPLAVSRGCGAPDVGAAGCAAPCVAVEYARSARREERDVSRVAGDAGHPARRHHEGSGPDGRHRRPESGVGGGIDPAELHLRDRAVGIR